MRKLTRLLLILLVVVFSIPQDLSGRPKGRKGKHPAKGGHPFKKKKKKKKHSKATACPSFH